MPSEEAIVFITERTLALVGAFEKRWGFKITPTATPHAGGLLTQFCRVDGEAFITEHYDWIMHWLAAYSE